MYFDHMIDPELHVHFIAATMADALETMHWEAKIDERNVEFMLGGIPGNEGFLPSCEKSEGQIKIVTRMVIAYVQHQFSD